MVEDWGVPSMSVGIVKDGNLIYAWGFGTKEEGKAERPDQHTLYAIASNSKAFTSAIVAMLVQEGKIDWDDRVQKYLPYFEIYDPFTSQQVTIRDLLCHRVGLGTFSGDIIWYQSDFTAEEIIRRIKYLPQAYPFRSGYGYSNLMYITAGELIKSVTGKSWTENVEERIFAKIGMARSIVGPTQLEEMGNYAVPHELQNGQTNRPIDWVDWTEVAATGGIISCVNDMAKWMQFNLENGVWNGDTLLTRESRNTLWTLHNNYTVDRYQPDEFNTHLSGYGLGWNLRDYDGHLFVGHTGGYDGMLTAVSLIPDEKLGVVVLTNGMKSPFMAANYYLIDALLGREERDWSQQQLERFNQSEKDDKRIEERKQKQMKGTHPSLNLEAYAGTYNSKIHGDIHVTQEDGSLRLEFKHAPAFAATLEHWHYDVFELNWDIPSAWFSFGTIKFNLDNNLEVTGVDFDVPNDDIFFEELKAVRVSKSLD
ncbi:MAG: serine hydrolase [Saprospiraceae bacterium]|nr:serine hydrolase [Saprospiraceae bacterium]